MFGSGSGVAANAEGTPQCLLSSNNVPDVRTLDARTALWRASRFVQANWWSLERHQLQLLRPWKLSTEMIYRWKSKSKVIPLFGQIC
jgi:hypothetical protein